MGRRIQSVGVASALLVGSLVTHVAPAHAGECHCMAIGGDVSAAIQGLVARADTLYARADFSGALALYVEAYGKAPSESVLLYAQAMAKWQLGATADAKALFNKYLSAGGTLAYRDLAEVALSDIGAGVSATVGGAVGGTLGVVGGVTGGVVGGVAGGVEGGVDAGLGGVGGVKKKVHVAHGAAVFLGVVAIAAIGVVGIHAIAAGIKDDISLDAKFDLGLGITGVAVGGTALYLGGLTVAAGAACAISSIPPRHPMVAPMATRGGGGIAAAMSF